MKNEKGQILTLSLSFNNNGPLGTIFRYICDNGTYIASYDDLFDGRENQIDLSGVAVSNNGVTIRMEVRGISSQGRDATGVRVMNIDDGDAVGSVAPILAVDED